MSSRFSEYTPEDYRARPRDLDFRIADLIVERVSNGEMLPEICESRDMPLPGTFLGWCDEDPDGLGERYRRARLRGADVNFDRIVIAGHHPDSGRAGAMSRALMFAVERTSPEKYAPRTVTRNTDKAGEDAAGFDAGASLRRRLDALATRLRTDAAPSDPEDKKD